MSCQLRSLLIASRDAMAEFFYRYSERSQRMLLGAALPAAAAEMPPLGDGEMPLPSGVNAVDRALYADAVTARRRPAIVLNLALVDAATGRPATSLAVGAASGVSGVDDAATPRAAPLGDAALALTPRSEDVVGAVEGMLAATAGAFSSVQRIEANVSHAGVALPENKRALSGLKGRDLPVTDTMAGLARVIHTNWVDACSTMRLLDPFKCGAAAHWTRRAAL